MEFIVGLPQLEHVYLNSLHTNPKNVCFFIFFIKLEFSYGISGCGGYIAAYPSLPFPGEISETPANQFNFPFCALNSVV